MRDCTLNLHILLNMTEWGFAFVLGNIEDLFSVIISWLLSQKSTKKHHKIHNRTADTFDLTRIDYHTHMTSPHVINNNPNNFEHIYAKPCTYTSPPSHEDNLSSPTHHGNDPMSHHPYQTLHLLSLNVKSSSLFSQSPYTTISQPHSHMSPDHPNLS